MGLHHFSHIAAFYASRKTPQQDDKAYCYAWASVVSKPADYPTFLVF